MKIIKVLFVCTVTLFVGVFVWAAFDLHHRIGFVLMAQGPVIIVSGVARFLRRGGNE